MCTHVVADTTYTQVILVLKIVVFKHVLQEVMRCRAISAVLHVHLLAQLVSI